MPHLSTDAGEVNTVVARTATVSAGDSDTVQIDAQEDRKIVGFEMEIPGKMGSDLNATARAYVGTDPIPGSDDAKDIGGKFAAEARLTQDNTNGWAHQGSAGLFDVDSDHAFDWNEDVTLTIEVLNNGASATSVQAQARIYYVEA